MHTMHHHLLTEGETCMTYSTTSIALTCTLMRHQSIKRLLMVASQVLQPKATAMHRSSAHRKEKCNLAVNS